MAAMRKFGTTKKNPNPPWPNQQSAVIVPPGSNTNAAGLAGQKAYEMPQDMMDTATRNSANTSVFVEDERGTRRDPIMGNMPVRQMQQNIQRPGSNNMTVGGMCGNMGVTGYLCGQTGKFVKLEFLFGENTHMEKTGILRQVGKDFVAIQENGTNNIIVCATGKIKFINIYEYGRQ